MQFVDATFVGCATTSTVVQCVSNLRKKLSANNTAQKRVRLFSITSHVDHGRSTLLDALIHTNGEKQKTQSTSTTVPLPRKIVTLHHQYNNQQHSLQTLVYPSNIDYSTFIETYRMSSDGTLIIVDSIESVCWTLERSLQYTIPSGVKPVLFINKIDRMFIELQLPAEDIYNSLVRIVESCNVAIATYQNDKLPNMQLCPVIGSVCFGSGKMGWGFTIKTFAKMYAKKFGIDEDRLATKLWGDNYFDPKNKKWVKSAQNGDDKPLKRAFCQFIIEPIYQIANAIMMDNHESLAKILLTLGVSLSEEEKRLQHRQKFQVVMKCLFPLNALLLDMLVEHLPSPVEAQQYRNVYKQQDYIYSQSIRACDPEGPLMIYVIIDFNASYAFGRIFSGKVRRGHIVRIVNGEKAETRVDLTGYLEQVSCGNYVVICGEGLTPKCTLADKEAYNCGEITLEINEK